jgi:CDP-diacylglycerol--serine O-phosphatidyltransferase
MLSVKKHIPNFITSLNITSGFAAIILASDGNILMASWFITAAMVFDFFDGFFARILNAYSDIGKELDSLADIISFGVAPAVILYQLMINVYPSAGLFIIIILSVMPVCAALRLAIFNLDTSQSVNFKGLATPANATAIITLVLASHFSDSKIIAFLINNPVAISIIAITLSLLMVSRLELFSLKVSNLKFKGNESKYLMLALLIIVFAITGMVGVALIIPVYIIASLTSRWL